MEANNRLSKFIDIVFKNEGFYSNDPADSGGETLYGISRNKNPKWKGWDIVDKYKLKSRFPKNMMSDKYLISIKNAFYADLYYYPCKIDLINDELLALHVFDFAVNAGVCHSAKTLQRLIGVKVDGKIGDITIKAVNSKTNALPLFKIARIDFYQSIAQKSLLNYEKKIGRRATTDERMKNTQYKFLKGWINRVNDLKI